MPHTCDSVPSIAAHDADIGRLISVLADDAMLYMDARPSIIRQRIGIPVPTASIYLFPEYEGTHLPGLLDRVRGVLCRCRAMLERIGLLSVLGGLRVPLPHEGVRGSASPRPALRLRAFGGSAPPCPAAGGCRQPPAPRRHGAAPGSHKECFLCFHLGGACLVARVWVMVGLWA